MSASRTTTITQPSASTSSRPADPPSPGAPIDKDEDEILREALARVERVKARKAAEEAEKKKQAAARRQAAQGACDRAIRAREQEDEIVEQRRKLAEAATARSQGGNSTGDVSASPRRPIVEISRLKSKGKGKAKVQPIGEDPDDGDDGDDDDDDEDDREPCERCRSKKIPCLKQAGKRSSVICKPCHNSKVRCSYSGRPYVVKKEGGSSPSGERLAVLESQMAQILADNRALREANLKTQQYLRQLLRRQEDDHTRLISMDTRMSLMGMGEGPAAAGPSRRTTERWRPLKRRRVVEESEEEREEEEEVEEREKETEKDGEGEEEEIVEEEMAPTEAVVE
ncbi:hypothetical protein LENED_010846 [Lentinula edodes]|uniref:Zn(2)-C6 fungal-type domain-containing protein n=1 Tax=Lentinula edodes TaxID=5353 RepID=A0A1Q3ENH8_LENED|nr:hypothetical protein LENED_010846 [Lentinula edodes]